MTIKEHLLRLFTGKDNATLDLGRVLWAQGTLVFSGLAIYHVIHTHTFDYQAFGLGFGAVLGAGGVAIWAKKDTEPQ
jgi:hypothetical protein